MVALVEAEVAAEVVVPLTRSLTEVEVVVEALKVLRREELEVEEGSSTVNSVSSPSVFLNRMEQCIQPTMQDSATFLLQAG